jgi:hypothetical protein
MHTPHAAGMLPGRRSLAGLAAVAVAVALGGCGSAAPAAAPTGSPKPIPVLQLAVLDAVGGRLSYCDPDQYPVASDPLQSAEERLPTIQGDTAAYAVILRHEHLSPGDDLTNAQVIAVSDLYKQMKAIDLVPEGDAYRFDFLVPKASSPTGNERVTGTVSKDGTVAIERRGPGERLACPICLAEGVAIATPTGPVAVQDVWVGMWVWSTDRQGRRIVAVVRRVGHMEAPIGHEVVRLALADGRVLVASPGHPTADGRTVGDLRSGDRLDGSRVVSADLLPYGGSWTYDLLPSGPTGTYVADGILLDSTLRSRSSPPSSDRPAWVRARPA